VIDRCLVGVARFLSSASVRWAGCRPGERQRIYFANHTSHLDFIVLWSALPSSERRRTRPVAGKDYWDRGAMRRYLANHVFRAVLVDRTAKSSACDPTSAARAAIDAMCAALADGDSLIVFPEGTRGAGGAVSDFKSGLYHLTQRRPDVELIPVHMSNLGRILPKGEVLPVPLTSRVIFGAPVAPPTDGETKPQFLTRAREALIALQQA
jgi:1-acyl-sn-glycerol-3-phosphate acyltransferase